MVGLTASCDDVVEILFSGGSSSRWAGKFVVGEMEF